MTALHLAAKNGQGNVVKALLAAGADFKVKDTEGKNALHYAAKYGHAKVVTNLLAGGANVMARGYDEADGIGKRQRRGLRPSKRLKPRNARQPCSGCCIHRFMWWYRRLVSSWSSTTAKIRFTSHHRTRSPSR